MAGHGPPPKPPGERRRRPSKAVEPPRVTLTTPPVSAPQLPGADDYSEATRHWYEVWASSPQASRFIGTDWQRLHMLAPLVDCYFREPDRALMAEIRLSEALLGATEADRLRLRWVVEGPAPEVEPKSGPGNADREAKILRLVGDDHS